jgi:hypothetical protein
MAIASEEGYAEEDTRKRVGCGMKTSEAEARIRSILQPTIPTCGLILPHTTSLPCGTRYKGNQCSEIKPTYVFVGST